MGRPAKDKVNYADTKAASMLRNAIARAKYERGTVLKDISGKLGMTQPVVISHMASGRIGIPVDRAPALADLLGMDRLAFTKAVLAQKHPAAMDAIDLQSLSPVGLEADEVHALQTDAAFSDTTILAAAKDIIAEVMRDRQPDARWLSIRELDAISLLRRLRPSMRTLGLSQHDLAAIRSALEDAPGPAIDS